MSQKVPGAKYPFRNFSVKKSKCEHIGLQMCISFVTHLFRMNSEREYTSFEIR